MGKVILLFCFLITAPALQGQTVYKTPSGQKYHLASCRIVKNVSEAISIAKVRELGLQPCLICKPPVLSGGPATHKEQGQSQTVQCKGMTKAGTRCKHKTSIANGYCFQHQPG